MQNNHQEQHFITLGRQSKKSLKEYESKKTCQNNNEPYNNQVYNHDFTLNPQNKPKKRTYNQMIEEFQYKQRQYPIDIGNLVIQGSFEFMDESDDYEKGYMVQLERQPISKEIKLQIPKEKRDKYFDCKILIYYLDNKIGILDQAYGWLLSKLLDKNYITIKCCFAKDHINSKNGQPIYLYSKIMLNENVFSVPQTKNNQDYDLKLINQYQSTKDQFESLFKLMKIQPQIKTQQEEQKNDGKTILQRLSAQNQEKLIKSESNNLFDRLKYCATNENRPISVKKENIDKNKIIQQNISIPVSRFSHLKPKNNEFLIQKDEISTNIMLSYDQRNVKLNDDNQNENQFNSSTNSILQQIDYDKDNITQDCYKQNEKNVNEILQDTTKQNSLKENDLSNQQKTENQLQYNIIIHKKDDQNEEYENQRIKLMNPPETLNITLYDYQRQALYWMLQREGVVLPDFSDIQIGSRKIHPNWRLYHIKQEYFYFNPFSGQLTTFTPQKRDECRGGILADEMGLGKTVMMISLIHANGVKIQHSQDIINDQEFNNDGQMMSKSKIKIQKNRQQGGNLVIVPMTLITQWEQEIVLHSKNSFRIARYFGKRNHLLDELHTYDIVLSSYESIAAEFKQYQKDSKSKYQKIFQMHWHRIILDEAHHIKTKSTLQANACFSLRATNRWCLTGTPIQNRVMELYSLLHFIKLEFWGDHSWWNNQIMKPLKRGEKNVYETIRIILKPIMLRRTKDSKDIQGNNIIKLPQKHVINIMVKQSQEEKNIYKAIFTSGKQTFDKMLIQNLIFKNMTCIFEIFMRLRQICDHPSILNSRTQIYKKQDLEQNVLQLLDELNQKRITLKNKKISLNEDNLKEIIQSILDENLPNCPYCDDYIINAVLTPCLHLSCEECLLEMIKIQPKLEIDHKQNWYICAICGDALKDTEIVSIPKEYKKQDIAMNTKKKSSKLRAVLDKIFEILNTKQKCVVFSQFLAMFDLIQNYLEKKNVKILRIQGSIDKDQRSKFLDLFTNDETYQVLLISLKAGGEGLNLTVANHVLLVDPWWNPAVEEQAISRVYRIGQKQQVFVYKFICEETIEHRMIDLHQQKQGIFNQVVENFHEYSDETLESKINDYRYLMQAY